MKFSLGRELSGRSVLTNETHPKAKRQQQLRTEELWVCLGVKTREVCLSFLAIIFLGSIVLTSRGLPRMSRNSVAIVTDINMT